MSSWRRTSLIAALALCAPLAFLGQVEIQPRQKSKPQEKRDDTPRPNIRIDTNLVLIPVAVNDELARPVAGLEKQHFKIFDNKVEQTITSFSMENEPIAMGLVFDTSGSMTGLLGESRLAANEFLRTAEKEDEFCLVEFDTTPRLTVPLTRDAGSIQHELLFSKAGGSTAMLDAIYLALHQVKKSKLERKALVVISDGGDNNSRYTYAEVRDVLRESDVLIYAIGIPGLLSEFTQQTGGRLYSINGQHFADIAAKIGTDLRNRYLLGYNPTNSKRDGLYHRVEVKVSPPRGLPQLKVHWRQGYYAPTD
jgi:Ca-activated chloride channel family protein